MGNRAFRCSVCAGNSFRHVTVPRPDGSHRTTALYECAGCSVVFCDADAFNANEPGPPSSRGPQPAPASYEPEMATYGKSPATITGDVGLEGGGKSLKTHVHSGVTTDGGDTGAPV